MSTLLLLPAPAPRLLLMDGYRGPAIMSAGGSHEDHWDGFLQPCLSIDEGPKRGGLADGSPWARDMVDDCLRATFREACLSYQRLHHRWAPNDYRRRLS